MRVVTKVKTGFGRRLSGRCVIHHTQTDLPWREDFSSNKSLHSLFEDCNNPPKTANQMLAHQKGGERGIVVFIRTGLTLPPLLVNSARSCLGGRISPSPAAYDKASNPQLPWK